MGSAVLSSVETAALPTGGRMVIGVCTLSCSYGTGGETMDLSAYLSGSPVVLCTPGNGFLAVHSQGNAAAGKVKLFTTSNGTTSQGLSEVASTANVNTCAFHFIAIGTPV